MVLNIVFLPVSSLCTIGYAIIILVDSSRKWWSSTCVYILVYKYIRDENRIETPPLSRSLRSQRRKKKCTLIFRARGSKKRVFPTTCLSFSLIHPPPSALTPLMSINTGCTRSFVLLQSAVRRNICTINWRNVKIKWYLAAIKYILI